MNVFSSFQSLMVATRSRAQSVIGESPSSSSSIPMFISSSDGMPGLDCVPAARLQRSRPLPPLQWRGQMSPWLLCLCAEKGWDKNNYIHYMNNEHEYCSWHDAFQISSVVSGGVVTQTTFCIQTTDSQNRRIVLFQARIHFQINSTISSAAWPGIVRGFLNY